MVRTKFSWLMISHYTQALIHQKKFRIIRLRECHKPRLKIFNKQIRLLTPLFSFFYLLYRGFLSDPECSVSYLTKTQACHALNSKNDILEKKIICIK